MAEDARGDSPGHRSLRAGRESVAGEWYAITTRAAGFDLRRVGKEIIAVAQEIETEGFIDLYCIVVMPDHCHLLFALRDGADLGGVMMRFKGRAPRRANETLSREGVLWQRAYYDRLLRSEDEARAQHWYLLDNPVRRGLADTVDAYPWTHSRQFDE